MMLPAVESAEELLALFDVPFEGGVLAGKRLVLLRGFARRRAEIDRMEPDPDRRWARYGVALREEYARCAGGSVPLSAGATTCAACTVACAVATARGS